MNPEETKHFANPEPQGKFNPDYQFHWGDFNNEPINNWQKIASTLLSIPMAHQLIGFYTVADDSDGALKVMRSYQYYAANATSDKVVFLMDRIERGTQSLKEYRGFAEKSESVQETEDTQVLKGKLKSINPADLKRAI